MSGAGTTRAKGVIRTDVCVVGAGAGGIGAAITAARLGRKVVLIERDRWLGGTTASGGVCVWQPAVCCARLCKEIYQRANAAGVAHIAGATCLPGAEMAVKRYDPATVYAYTMVRHSPWTPQFANGPVIVFSPLGYDRTIREMLAETGNCRVLDGTEFMAPVLARPGQIRAVVARSAAGTFRIEGEQYIDCTAEVTLARAVGVEVRWGEDPKSLYGEPSAPEEESPRLNGVTLMYRVGEGPGLERPPDCEDYRDGSVHGSADIAEIPGGDYCVNNCFMMSGDEAYEMGLEEAYEVLRRRIWLCWDLTRTKYGLKGCEIVWVVPRLGIREGPRMVGRHVMTEHDFRAGMKGQKHDDIIAVSSHAMDTHGERSYCVEAPNGPYGIPFRCLQPREIENLLVASRGASFSHLAASAVRLQRTIMELGIAAGRAAAGVDPVPARSYWDY